MQVSETLWDRCSREWWIWVHFDDRLRSCLLYTSDAAVEQVNGLTPDSTVADAQQAGDKLKGALSALNKAEGQLEKAEVKQYRDQVDLFRKAVAEVSKNKDLTLAEAAEQLKGKAAPLLAAREQLASTTVCIDVADDSADAKADEKPKS